MKKRLLLALAVLFALAPLTLSVACENGDNSANVTPPIQQETPTEETPGEEEPSEEAPKEDPSEENSSEEDKPSLPGGLVDGGNFESDKFN